MKIIISLISIFLISQFASGQNRARKIDSITEIIHNKNPEVSISIGFIDHGKEYFFNYGKISRKSNLAVNENTIYEIGSITKLFTANLIAQAQQEGKLNVGDYIDQYLPIEYKLPEAIRNKIKISDLASHQSGLPDFNFKKLLEEKPDQPLDIENKTIHSLINDSTRLSDYGVYRYSNISYVLMGMMLEKVYHQDFEEILKQNILIPAGMKNTYTSRFEVKNRVTGYDQNGKKREYFNWNSLSAPAGLVKSNTSDILKLLKILIDKNNQISKASKITEKTFFKNTQREVALGREIERNGDDYFFYKTGDTFSCSSILAYDKKSDWGIIILINQHNSELIRNLINTNYIQALD